MKMSSKNHGSTTSKAKGMSVRTDYGRDNSDVTGSSAQERTGSPGGGKDNLSHSLSGSSAKQRQS